MIIVSCSCLTCFNLIYIWITIKTVPHFLCAKFPWAIGSRIPLRVLFSRGVGSHIQRERISCNKDQGGINKVLIEKCLSDSNININGIEQVVVTNTQYREFYFEDYDYFNFNYSPNYLNSEIDKFFKENINNYIKSYEIFHSFFSESNRRISEVNIKQYPQ